MVTTRQVALMKVLTQTRAGPVAATLVSRRPVGHACGGGAMTPLPRGGHQSRTIVLHQALAQIADADRRYSAARRQALAALASARSLGTQGHRTWTRDELHER